MNANEPRLTPAQLDNLKRSTERFGSITINCGDLHLLAIMAERSIALEAENARLREAAQPIADWNDKYSKDANDFTGLMFDLRHALETKV